MIVNTDFELDCLVAKILGFPPPSQDNESFLTTIGYAIPDIDERRLMAIKVVQKYFADFKASEAKPVNKMYLLAKDVNPYLIDKYLTFLNKLMVEYGVTTKKRAESFITILLRETNNLSTPYKQLRPSEDEIKTFCDDWLRARGNYLTDSEETETLSQYFLGLR